MSILKGFAGSCSRARAVLFLLVVTGVGGIACSASAAGPVTQEVATELKSKQTTAFDLNWERERPRTFILPPLVSLFLPGFDQFWEGQLAYGFGYAGGYLVGYGMATGAGTLGGSITTRNDRARWGNLGAQMMFTAGEFSTYHSFRTAVRSRKAVGDFAFLKHEESPSDLWLSPFRTRYLSRPTTYIGIPAMLAFGLAMERLKGSRDWVSTKWNTPTVSDVGFAGAFSFNAGTGEEALFRGYLMPVAMKYTGSEIASNAMTALLFGAVHISSRNPYPISQTIGGFYLGYVAQQDEWRLGESIFIHTWFDVVAFLVSYTTTDVASGPKPPFCISPFSIPF